MSTTKKQEVYRIPEAPTHPLAQKYGITERMFRRAVQKGLISYARPGGRVVLLASEDIEEYILGSRVVAVNP